MGYGLPRFGAIGEHGSVAVVERFIRSLQYEFLNRLVLPLCLRKFEQLVTDYLDWHSSERPHRRFDGRTPDEVWRGEPKGNSRVFEPRARYPDRGRVLAAPKGTVLVLDLERFRGHRELPVISIRPAA